MLVQKGEVATGRLSKMESPRPGAAAGRYGLGHCGMVVMVVGGGCLRCAGKRGGPLFMNVSQVLESRIDQSFLSCMNAHHFQRPSIGPMSLPWKDS